MKLFFTSFIQVGLVAASTVCLSSGNIPGIAVSAFGTNYVWTYNVRRTVVATQTERLFYALGATCGALFGYFTTHMLLR